MQTGKGFRVFFSSGCQALGFLLAQAIHLLQGGLAMPAEAPAQGQGKGTEWAHMSLSNYPVSVGSSDMCLFFFFKAGKYLYKKLQRNENPCFQIGSTSVLP